MAEDNLNKNFESEIFTIPEEFYGAQRRAPVVKVESSSFKKDVGVPLPVPVSVPKRSNAKRSLNLSSPKFVITAIVILMVVVVGGFSYYYINQAQVARQKILDAQKPLPQPVVVPPVETIPTPPVEVPVEATSTPAVVTPQPVSFAVFPFKNYTKAADTDNDELTNIEEVIYGTLADKPDTDEDGFPDGLEVINLYNPLGFKPVKLIDSGKVKNYVNPTYNYSVLSPLTWVVQALDANNEQVIFSSDTGEFIEILVEDNPLKLSVSDWYLGQSPGVSASDLKTVTTKDGLVGILSPDGLAAYLPFEDRIFVIYYNIGLQAEVNFLATFKMMINSFKVGVSAMPVTEVNTTTSTVESAPSATSSNQ
ncbi:MAG: hypothetical protein NTU97_04940 [Candidatus Magasanikbacteria bacterium]|nr:hypothetical protein [Candidatus Magasanikbacteria bacterium]